MRNYILRRLLYAVPTIILTAMLVFLIMRMIPGDAALLMAVGGEGATGNLQVYETLKHQLGLDRPLYVQFVDWLWQFVRYGDLGTSYWTKDAVMSQILSRLPVTLELAIGATIIGVGIAIPWGVMAAIRQDRAGDYVPRVVSVILLSAPNFWIGTLLVVLPAIWFRYMPPLGYVSFFDNPLANMQQFVFPWLALGTRLIGTSLRMTRSTMLEVMHQDYIRTAWAKGLRERGVVYRHALNNAMIPVVTVIGGQIAFLLGGSVVIETVFGLPGLGSLTLQSIYQRDYPQIQGNVLFIALIVIGVNLIIDISYAWFDPRIRYK
jgi:peptide/nickel transport system permease protein